MKHHLTIEQPDQEVTIDFLSFHPAKGVKVEGVTVKVKLEYNPHTQEASLYVYAEDAADSTILFDNKKPVSVGFLD